MNTNFLTNNSALEINELDARVSSSLAQRLESASDYDQAEILAVSELDKRLFPKGFEVPEKARETMRILCSYSRCELRPARAIKSHRKFLGPLIVRLKKLTWPLIRFHLKDTFDSMQLFHSWVVYSQARQIIELEEVKKQISKIKLS